MSRTRLSAAVYLVLVFASGILVGAAGNRLYTTTSASANSAPRTPDEWRKRYLEQMKKRVGVSDDQIAKTSQILDDTRKLFDNVHAKEKQLHDSMYAEQVEEIKAILTPAQQVAFDEWRAERQRERDKAQKAKK
jgi:Spy/CpxP family protein refolding chaperone